MPLLLSASFKYATGSHLSLTFGSCHGHQDLAKIRTSCARRAFFSTAAPLVMFEKTLCDHAAGTKLVLQLLQSSPERRDRNGRPSPLRLGALTLHLLAQ